MRSDDIYVLMKKHLYGMFWDHERFKKIASPGSTSARTDINELMSLFGKMAKNLSDQLEMNCEEQSSLTSGRGKSW